MPTEITKSLNRNRPLFPQRTSPPGNPHSLTEIAQRSMKNNRDTIIGENRSVTAPNNVVQTNVVKMLGIVRIPGPRMARMMGGLRNVFTRGRADKREMRDTVFEFAKKRSTVPEANSPKQSDGGVRTRPAIQLARLGALETTGLEDIRMCLNSVGRRLVQDEDVERRKVWFRVSTPSIVKFGGVE